MVLDNILPLKRLKEIDEEKQKLKHIAFDISEVAFLEKLWKEKGEESTQDIISNLDKKNELIKAILDLQIKNKIPIVTLYVSKKRDKPIFYGKIYDKFNEIFQFLEEVSTKNGIRVTIVGKWYDVPNSTLDSIRRMIDRTKNNESFFLNMCINYDGREEIIDSCKILAHKAKSGKILPNEITEENFKENIYISKFSAPDRIVVMSKKNKLSSFLLWDSSESRIFFTEKGWNEINPKDVEKYYQ